LRQHAKNRKVAGSIPNEVIKYFNWPNPYTRTICPRVDSAFNRNKY
jgi:hypothetical protein